MREVAAGMREKSLSLMLFLCSVVTISRWSLPMMVNVIGAGSVVCWSKCWCSNKDCSELVGAGLTHSGSWPLLLDQYLISFILLHPTFRQFLEILQQTCLATNTILGIQHWDREWNMASQKCQKLEYLNIFPLSQIKYLLKHYVDLLYSCVCNI